MAATGSAFADPVDGAQSVFRATLAALARPGTIRDLPADLAPPGPLTPELAALALALADPDAPIWLDETLAREPAVADYLRFQTGAAIVRDPAEAALALVRRPESMPPADAFALGTPDYPDRSTTLVLAVDALDAEGPFELAGPGIRTTIRFGAAPLPMDFADRVAANHALFPRGVDWVLVGGGRVLGLPRSSSLSVFAEAEAA